MFWYLCKARKSFQLGGTIISTLLSEAFQGPFTNRKPEQLGAVRNRHLGEARMSKQLCNAKMILDIVTIHDIDIDFIFAAE